MHKKMNNPTIIPKSEVVHVEMMVDPVIFEKIMDDDKYKNYIKERLAIDLAKKILESNRTTFTYSPAVNSPNYHVHARIIL